MNQKIVVGLLGHNNVSTDGPVVEKINILDNRGVGGILKSV
jgi:hypothetical protein